MEMKIKPLVVAVALATVGCSMDDAARHQSSEMNATAVATQTGAKGGVKVAFLGNSITLHDAAPNIGWTNVWGMAASAEERDYVHLVTRGIERETGRTAEVIVRNIADFERNFATYDVRKNLGDVIDFRPDSICLHGDTKEAVSMAAAVRRALEAKGVEISPMDASAESEG